MYIIWNLLIILNFTCLMSLWRSLTWLLSARGSHMKLERSTKIWGQAAQLAVSRSTVMVSVALNLLLLLFLFCLAWFGFIFQYRVPLCCSGSPGTQLCRPSCPGTQAPTSSSPPSFNVFLSWTSFIACLGRTFVLLDKKKLCLFKHVLDFNQRVLSEKSLGNFSHKVNIWTWELVNKGVVKDSGPFQSTRFREGKEGERRETYLPHAKSSLIIPVLRRKGQKADVL